MPNRNNRSVNLPPSPRRPGAGVPHRASTPTDRLGRALTINYATLHGSPGERWAGLPAKPKLTRESESVNDEASGRLILIPILEWLDRATANTFGAAVEAKFPGARA
jgi:hypothetical protein